jgi:hypothetical protein
MIIFVAITKLYLLQLIQMYLLRLMIRVVYSGAGRKIVFRENRYGLHVIYMYAFEITSYTVH